MTNRIWRFDATEEADFRNRFNEKSIYFVRASLPIAVTLYLVFVTWDVVLAPAELVSTLGVRLPFSFLAMAVFGLTFVPGFSRWSQPVLAATVISGGAGVLLVLFIIPGGFDYGVSGVLLVVMYACGFIRLLLLPAAVACVTIVAIGNLLLFVNGASSFIFFNTNIFLISAVVIGLCYTALLEWMERRAFLLETRLEQEKRASEEMVRAFIPDAIAAQLRGGKKTIAEAFGEATIFFADIVGFTSLTRRLSPGHLLEVLSDIFSAMDALAEKHGVDKVKTIGDNYMAVGGVKDSSSSSVENVAEFAIDVLQFVDRYAQEKDLEIQVRIGIATGAIVAGVVGAKVPIFDMWGETVNLASRLESHGEPGTIQVSESSYWRLRNRYEFEERGQMQLKGGITETVYTLTGRKIAKSSEQPVPASNVPWPNLRAV